jgi:3-oxoacyl-[acyl-carrier-protein] synthase II
LHQNFDKILVRGTGLVTPLGGSREETWRAILEERFISDHSRSAGEFDGTSPRVVQMARRVAAEALAEAGWAGDGYATVVGTSKGSIENWLATGGLDASGLGDIAARLGRGVGPKLTVSAACASGLVALIRGAMLIHSGEARRVLVVAAEASVHPLFLGSFKRLGVLPAAGIGCRPFDETRDGFLMSEAAAAVCIEAGGGGEISESVVSPEASSPAYLETGVPLVGLESFALGADATHLTASDPAGRVLEHLINKITLNRPVDLVHAHGTGTIANDATELAVIERVLGRSSAHPSLYSHKGALGHSLGAAGLVAVVLNVMAHRHGVVPPNVKTRQPLPAKTVTISQAVQRRRIDRSIVLAAGFGGSAAAIGLVTYSG